MNGYYPRYPPEGGEDNMVGGVMGQDGMSSSGMVGAQSLDDIVNENAKAMRRRSVPVAFGNNTPVTMGEQDMRRVSMMEFGGTSPPLDSFAFDPNAGSLDGMMRSENSYYTTQNSQFPTSATGYSNNMQAASSLDVDMASPYMASNLGMSMDMSDQAFNSMTGNDVSSMSMYGQGQFGSPMMGSPVHADFNTVMAPTTQVGGMRLNDPQEQLSTTDKHSATPDMPSRTSSQNQSARSNSRPQSTPLSSNRSPQHQMSASQFGPEAPPPSSVPTSQPPSAYSQLKFPWVDPPGGFPSSMHGRTHIDGQFKNAYSQTGFDMLGVLMRVATRPNPEINIGSVDLSCAFVVCDAEKDDNPIVYCSENFERLTGYDRHMILGRNCRFLQSPDGKVQPGQKRQFCDDDSVLYLKNCISMRRESQISLINYRRGGQPFMNLLTMIPISWDSDVTKFFVGFQVDLVEQPNAVTNKNADGTYAINYQRGITMPRYIAPGERVQQELAGQTISREEVSTILSSFGTTGDSEFTKRVWDKVLLENADDVVHVLSLKGLFLYLSPSSKKILEYEPNELVGTALSSVCHPSDIVPVTRELKDTSSGVSVNVVFRIRRKLSGYMWWEGNGSLHTEQGKGRKCIILVGRERPVYTLNKHHILEAGGIGENELWTKMSTTGMFLYVSSNVRQLLDRHPDELVGTSIQALMRQDSKQEFGRILMLAYTGKRASVKHEMMNKRGQILQAFTTIYPGDAVEGQKPTFLIAQTRMLKFSRSSNQTNHRNSLLGKADSAGGVTPLSTIGSTSHVGNTGNNTPMSLQGNKFASTEGSAATYAGSNGLPLGRQDASLASDENLFEELKTVRSTSWQFELRQMEKRNRLLAEEVQSLLAAKKKRKRRKGAGQLQKDCANCHTRVTPEWRRGPSGNRDLCNSCGLRWAKQVRDAVIAERENKEHPLIREQNGRVSPRTSSQHSVSAQSDRGSKASASPRNQSSSMKAPETSGESTPQLPDGHGTKAARIEVAASQGVIPSVPPPIKEANEQDG